MARNEEKALTLFSRWTTFKKDYHSNVTDKRPFIASECDNLVEAEKWRRELIRDITKKTSLIANATLGEHRIREMNDEINKMMRQKHHWEVRIRELGGDVLKGRQFYDIDGKQLPGAPGYKYYGAAKQLPGVRELFAEQEDEFKQKRQKRSRGDMYKNITPDYYGYRDDDDGVLMEKEAKREKELIEIAEREYMKKKREVQSTIKNNKADTLLPLSSDDLLYIEEESDEGEDASLLATIHDSFLVESTSSAVALPVMLSALTSKDIKSHVSVPSSDDIQAVLLEQKRQKLLAKLSM